MRYMTIIAGHDQHLTCFDSGYGVLWQYPNQVVVAAVSFAAFFILTVNASINLEEYFPNWEESDLSRVTPERKMILLLVHARNTSGARGRGLRKRSTTRRRIHVITRHFSTAGTLAGNKNQRPHRLSRAASIFHNLEKRRS